MYEVSIPTPLRDLTPDELDRMATLSRISELLNASYDLDEVLRRVMDVVIRALGAQRGFVMLDRGGDEPEVAAARGLDEEPMDGESYAFSRNLVRQLLSLSRREKGPRRRISTRELVEGGARLLETEYRRQGVELAVDVAEDDATVEVNVDHLNQVTINLLTNALHAVRGRSDARVVLRVHAPDDRVRLTVSDNGPGIPPQNLRQIFDPFFTTRPAGEGTGLGLSVSHSIVAEHGGVLTAHNDRQGGAVLTVELPRADAAKASGAGDANPIVEGKAV